MSLTKKLETVAKNIGAVYTLKGRTLSHSEVVSEAGLLPGFAKRADQLSQLCFGYGIGASYEDTDKAVLGIKVIFDEFTPDSLRLFTIVDVLHEFVRSSYDQRVVELDDLLRD